MDEYEDLDVYNDDTIHNMWVDLDNIAHTGATRVCDDGSIADYINNLSDWD